MDNEILNQILVELKQFREETNKRFDQVDLSLHVIQTGQQGTREEITQRFKETNKKIDDLQKDVEFTYLETAKNKLELNKLKK